jgi:hypothetical protein
VTKGWVLIPGESAHIVLYGDGDDNEGYTGFEVDRTAWWSGIVYYDTLGPFEKIDGLEEDVADYFITRSSEFTPIR